MKYIVSILLIICLLSCETSDKNIDSNLTGNNTEYPLYQGSDYNISGIVTFKESNTHGAIIHIELTGTEKGLFHPTHLHFGNIEENGDIAAVLNPVEGESGISTTTLEFLDASNKITYSQLLEMEASIKVHLSDTEPGKHTILAGGNVGMSATKGNPFGKIEIAVCKSN